MERRSFFTSVGAAFAGFYAGFSSTEDERQVYDEINRGLNQVIYEFCNVRGTNRLEVYNQMHEESVRKAVTGYEIPVNLIDVDFREQRIGYEIGELQDIADNVEDIFSDQLDVSMDFDVNQIGAEKIVEGDETENSLFNELQHTSWRINEEGKGIEGFVNSRLGDYGKEDRINVYVLPFDSRYFQRRAGSFNGNTILLDKRRPKVVEYLLDHEIGHQIGLPHPENGTGVMSYSPDRIIRGELGLIEKPFGEESIENWEWVRDKYLEENPGLQNISTPD